MENKTGFFEEAPGQKSSTRLFSFVLLLFFVAFNLLYAIRKELLIDFNFIFYMTIVLIGIFAPKYLQKLAELKLGKIEQPNK